MVTHSFEQAGSLSELGIVMSATGGVGDDASLQRWISWGA
jgi:hypothetical protein